MMNIIKLEMKKFKIGGYVRGALITDFIIAFGFWFMVCITPPEEIAAGMASFSGILIPKVEFLVRSVFIVYASLLIGRLIIEEYSNKTISVLFTYPIGRKTLFTAKLSIVAAFTFSLVIISDVFITALLYLLNILYPVLHFDLTVPIAINSLFSFFMSAIAASGMGLVPLYFGMLKKSTTAAIISAVLMAVLLRFKINGFSVNSFALVSVFLAGVGIVFAYMTIRNIERKDVNV